MAVNAHPKLGNVFAQVIGPIPHVPHMLNHVINVINPIWIRVQPQPIPACVNQIGPVLDVKSPIHAHNNPPTAALPPTGTLNQRLVVVTVANVIVLIDGLVLHVNLVRWNVAMAALPTAVPGVYVTKVIPDQHVNAVVSWGL